MDDDLLAQELSNIQNVVSWCIVVVKQRQFFFLSKPSFCLTHWTKNTRQDILVDLMIDNMALWQKLAIDDAPHIEQRDQHDFHFWLCLDFPDPMTLETFADCFGVWFWGLIQKTMSHPQEWLYKESLVLSEEVQLCLETPEWDTRSDHHLAILVLFFAKIFSISKSSVIIFQTPSFFISCDHSNCQWIIVRHAF